MNLLTGSPQQGAGMFWSPCSGTFRSRLCYPLGKPPRLAAGGRGADPVPPPSHPACPSPHRLPVAHSTADLSALLPDPQSPHLLPSSSSHDLSCPHHPSFLRHFFGLILPDALHCAHLLDRSLPLSDQHPRLPPPGLRPRPSCRPRFLSPRGHGAHEEPEPPVGAGPGKAVAAEAVTYQQR